MTEFSDMLTSLKRIEATLASIQRLLAEFFEKPKIEQQSVGLHDSIRAQLRRLRSRETKT